MWDLTEKKNENGKQEVLGRTNLLLSFHYVLNILYGRDRIKNTASNSPSIVEYVFFAAGTCLPSRCLKMPVFSGFTLPALRRYGGEGHRHRDNNVLS
jgi:hypothetical protein